MCESSVTHDRTGRSGRCPDGGVVGARAGGRTDSDTRPTPTQIIPGRSWQTDDNVVRFQGGRRHRHLHVSVNIANGKEILQRVSGMSRTKLTYFYSGYSVTTTGFFWGKIFRIRGLGLYISIDYISIG